MESLSYRRFRCNRKWPSELGDGYVKVRWWRASVLRELQKDSMAALIIAVAGGAHTGKSF
jgi:hypothetical protein